MSEADLPRMDRRKAIAWMLAAGAGVAVAGRRAFGATMPPAASPGPHDGYGVDPNLIKVHAPGEYWPLTFDTSTRRLVAALCDIIVPAEGQVPSASALGVHDLIDEWISAPYMGHQDDRELILEGLAWVERESKQRFGTVFALSSDDQRQQLCEMMAEPAHPGSAMAQPAKFFRRLRDLVAMGFFSTPAGMRDLGYVGNLPLARFEGPPAELIDKLGLSGEVQW